MPLVITCPACRQKARVPDAMLGQSVKCPACGTTFTAPADEPSAAAPPEPVTVAAAEPVPVRPPLADADSLCSVRSGVGVQLIAHCLYAAALGLFLMLCAVSFAGTLSPSGFGGGRGRGVTYLPQLIFVAAMLSITIGGLLSLVGGALCTLAPTAQLARGLAIASLLVSVLSAERTVNVIAWIPQIEDLPLNRSSSFAGPWIYASIVLVWLFEIARLSVLALFWRSMSRVVRDTRNATNAYRLAIAGPVVQFALVGAWIVMAVVGVSGPEVVMPGLVGWLALQFIVVLAGIGIAARLRRRLHAALLQ